MTLFLLRLVIIGVLLFLGESVLADEEALKSPPLPQRDTSVLQIDGYADWKFTDSLETRQNNNRLTDIEAGEEKCEFGKEATRARLVFSDESVEVFHTNITSSKNRVHLMALAQCFTPELRFGRYSRNPSSREWP